MAKIIFVNAQKLEDATRILGLVTGKVIPKTDEEDEKKAKFTGFLAAEKVDAKGEDALEFIYTKLGGLVRTEAQEAQAQAKKKEIQAKGRKKMIE